MDTKAYFERINYHGPLTPTAETLKRLHVAHLLAVPFENLSIHAGQPIVLDGEALFEKIVIRRRGGFCYELNGLFAALLRTLGFDVEMLAAAVYKGDGRYGLEFAHMTLMVTLEERWLADVGFGDSFVEPLRLDERGLQSGGPRNFRLDADGERLVMMRNKRDGTWEPQYRFTLQPYAFADFGEMCHYQQTSPESHFTQDTICTRATADGRVTLSGMRLISRADGVRHEQALRDEAEVAEALRVHFGIVMDS